MEHEFRVGLKPRPTVKASLSTADYGRASLITPYERAASPMKSVRRDEVARLYGVSESVKNTLS